MTKRESNILKCVAILLMLAHHLFMYADQPGFPELVYGPLLNTPERLAAFGQLSKLCVTIFVFVSAYGTAMSFRGDGMEDNRAIMALSTRRWVKLLASFQLVYLITFALCPLGGKSWFTVYSPSRLENLFFALVDFLGLSYIISTPSYNSSWWYMSLAITLILTLPWLIKCCRRYGFFLLLPVLLLVRWTNVEFVFFRYVLITLLGILLAEYGTVERVKAWSGKARLPLRVLAILLCLLLTGAVSVLWLRAGEGLMDIYEALLCLGVCFLTLTVLAPFPGLNSAAEFLGRHSMNIYFFHVFIYEVWFYKFTYSLRYPALIFLFLLCSSLLFSILVEGLKKLLHFDRLVACLSDWACRLLLPKEPV
ncbi:MAG: acyltransferase family protein [Candidatus Limivicinus sp.]